MKKSDFIVKFIELDNLFDMAVAIGDEKAMSKISDELMSLHQRMSEELTEQEAFEVSALLDARDRDKKEFGF